jgi:hypothetical protein
MDPRKGPSALCEHCVGPRRRCTIQVEERAANPKSEYQADAERAPARALTLSLNSLRERVLQGCARDVLSTGRCARSTGEFTPRLQSPSGLTERFTTNETIRSSSARGRQLWLRGHARRLVSWLPTGSTEESAGCESFQISIAVTTGRTHAAPGCDQEMMSRAPSAAAKACVRSGLRAAKWWCRRACPIGPPFA